MQKFFSLFVASTEEEMRKSDANGEHRTEYPNYLMITSKDTLEHGCASDLFYEYFTEVALILNCYERNGSNIK